MAYDEKLADRLRESLSTEHGLTEKRMFGGLAFLIDGKMAVCAGSHGTLMVRVDPAQSDALIADGRAERMVMNGRELNGWLEVRPEHVATQDAVDQWTIIGVGFARSLPAKQR